MTKKNRVESLPLKDKIVYSPKSSTPLEWNIPGVASVTYDPVAKSLYVKVKPTSGQEHVYETKTITSPGVLVDSNENGEVVGIEIIGK